MTADVIKALEIIADNLIFDDDLYFVGGTALAYYINHRISEDIDIVSIKNLNYKKIIPAMTAIGAKKVEDENITALRLAGLFPDEYIIKFRLKNVKLEFFQANRDIQKRILKDSSYINYKNSKLKVLDVKSIAKLKIVAFFQRDKLRDLFDFGAILDNKILSIDEILELTNEIKDIKDKKELIRYIKNKKEAKDDEFVYLDEKNKVNISFEKIKKEIVFKITKK